MSASRFAINRFSSHEIIRFELADFCVYSDVVCHVFGLAKWVPAGYSWALMKTTFNEYFILFFLDSIELAAANWQLMNRIIETIKTNRLSGCHKVSADWSLATQTGIGGRQVEPKLETFDEFALIFSKSFSILNNLEPATSGRSTEVSLWLFLWFCWGFSPIQVSGSC